MSAAYSLADRNIHLRNGKFRVLLVRRPTNIYGGSHDTLEAARIVRDQLEAQHAKLKPWGIRGHLVQQRRTTQSLRDERLAAGLCQMCGSLPPKPGHKSCQECCDWQNQKRIDARRKLKEQTV